MLSQCCLPRKQPPPARLQVLLTAVFALLHQQRLGYADVGLSYDRVSWRGELVARQPAVLLGCRSASRLAHAATAQRAVGLPMGLPFP